MEIKIFKGENLLYHYADFYDVEVTYCNAVRVRKFLLVKGLKCQTLSTREWDKVVITK